MPIDKPSCHHRADCTYVGQVFLPDFLSNSPNIFLFTVKNSEGKKEVRLQQLRNNWRLQGNLIKILQKLSSQVDFQLVVVVVVV